MLFPGDLADDHTTRKFASGDELSLSLEQIAPLVDHAAVGGRSDAWREVVGRSLSDRERRLPWRDALTCADEPPISSDY